MLELFVIALLTPVELLLPISSKIDGLRNRGLTPRGSLWGYALNSYTPGFD